MTKAELEAERDAYFLRLDEARRCERDGRYSQAIKAAKAALAHVDGMMQFARKYKEGTFHSVAAIDLLLKYAPLLLDADALIDVAVLLEMSRRVERDTTADMGQKLADAQATLGRCHRLWGHIEEASSVLQGDLRKSLGGDQDEWRVIVESWETMGLVRRVLESGTYRVSFVSDMARTTRGKCSECGAVVSVPKFDLLAQRPCESCGIHAQFVILDNFATGESGELHA